MPVQRVCRPFWGARADHHRGSGLAPEPGGLGAESDMTGGDDDVASRQVDACEHVRCRRGRGESRSDGTLVLCHASTISPLGRTLNGCESIFLRDSTEMVRGQLSDVFDLVEVRGLISGGVRVRGDRRAHAPIRYPLKLTAVVRVVSGSSPTAWISPSSCSPVMWPFSATANRSRCRRVGREQGRRPRSSCANPIRSSASTAPLQRRRRDHRRTRRRQPCR